MVKYLERYPIAIDLSDVGSVHALQLTGSGSTPVIRATARQKCDVDATMLSEEDAAAFIRDVLRSRAFSGKSVALLPRLDAVLSYPLRVAPDNGEPLEAAIVREARGVLEIPIETAMLDYASVQPDPSGQENVHQVLVVAIRKDDVNCYQRLIREAGGFLEVVESVASALTRVHNLATPLGRKPVIICNIGRLQSTIVVAHSDGISAHRNANWGTDDLRRKLVANLELGNHTQDADFLLQKHGLCHAVTPDTAVEIPAGDISGTVSQLLAPMIGTFIHELHNMTGYIRSQIPSISFGGIFLYGEASHVAGLDRYLGREMNMEVRTMSPVTVDGRSHGQAALKPTDGDAFSLAMGLGLRRVRWL